VASFEQERSGLLILRIQLVADRSCSPARLAAKMTTTLDLSTREEQTQTMAGSLEEILVLVRLWMVAFVDGSMSDDSLTKQ
jgi:hypothetical protein